MPHLPLIALLLSPSARCESPQVELVHRIPAGRTVEVTLHQVESSTLDVMSWSPVVNGARVLDDALDLDVEEEREFDITIGWKDHYGELDEHGRLASLRRSLESIAAPSDWTRTVEGETESEESEWTTPLMGRTVDFALDDDGETYDATFEGEGRSTGFDAVLLEGLRIDAFGDWYLPEREHASVAPGDTWDAGIEAWHRTLDIGGDFWVEADRDEPPTDEEVEARRSFRGQLRSGGEGEVRCTFAGLQTVDGVELAVIEIELVAEVSAEVASIEEAEDAGGDLRVATSVVLDLDGTGTCLWNPVEGVPHSIVLEVAWRSTDTRVEEPEDGEHGNAWTSVTEHTMELEYRFVLSD